MGFGHLLLVFLVLGIVAGEENAVTGALALDNRAAGGGASGESGGAKGAIKDLDDALKSIDASLKKLVDAGYTWSFESASQEQEVTQRLFGIRQAIDHLQRERFARTYMAKGIPMSPYGAAPFGPGAMGAAAFPAGGFPLGPAPIAPFNFKGKGHLRKDKAAA